MKRLGERIKIKLTIMNWLYIFDNILPVNIIAFIVVLTFLNNFMWVVVSLFCICSLCHQSAWWRINDRTIKMDVLYRFSSWVKRSLFRYVSSKSHWYLSTIATVEKKELQILESDEIFLLPVSRDDFCF